MSSLIEWLERLDANPGEIVGTRDALVRARGLVDAIHRCERALAPFDVAHCVTLEGGDPARVISLADLREASKTYHSLPDAERHRAEEES